MSEPDFHLASSESVRFAESRACYVVRRIRGEHRDDLLLVRIDAPVVGQPFGLGASDLHEVVLAARHRGASLFPIRQWPVAVHIARPLVSLEGREIVRDVEIESIAWGELYEHASAAADAARAAGR